MACHEMQVALEQRKSRYEESIRRDAVQRSQSVTLGRVTDHFAP
ncbi:MAG: Holliday junction resolvase-like protein [Anaerolineae bacterium]